jgi:hypothetical protein
MQTLSQTILAIKARLAADKTSLISSRITTPVGMSNATLGFICKFKNNGKTTWFYAIQNPCIVLSFIKACSEAKFINVDKPKTDLGYIHKTSSFPEVVRFFEKYYEEQKKLAAK